jgi:HlyD family secretion protein
MAAPSLENLKGGFFSRWMLAIGLGTVLAGGTASYLYFFPGQTNANKPGVLLHQIKRETLDLTVIERGTLESAFNQDVICKVKAGTKGANNSTSIKWVIEDGTQVKKGQLICLLDASALEDSYRAQKIVLDQAEAAYISATENYKIVESQNESDEETARIAIQLAELDLEKYAGLPKGTVNGLPREEARKILNAMEKNLEDFLFSFKTGLSAGLVLKGEFQQALDDVNGRIELAESDLEMWKDRTGYSQRMRLKGYVSASQVQSDESRLASSNEALKKVRMEKDLLQRFTAQRTVKDLSSKVQEAWRAFDRTKTQARAKDITASIDRDKKKSVYDEEKKKLEEIDEQINLCKLHAPQDGMVVYYVPEQSRFGSGSQQSIIAQGEPVREGQKIMRIPDLKRMQVSTRVHEAMISRIKGDDRRSTGFTEAVRVGLLMNQDPIGRIISQQETIQESLREAFLDQEYVLASKGQNAGVRVDAFAEQKLEGHVKVVATVAAQQDWMSSDVKVYTTLVSIDSQVEGLKPGMSAEVTIEIESPRAGVLAIPLPAVIGGAESGATRTCLIMTDFGPQEREIKLGMANDKIAEVVKGLEEGDKVVLNPKHVLGNAIKTQEEKTAPSGGQGGRGQGKGKGAGGPPGAGKGGPPSMPKIPG